jgi:hypothetical protein
MKDIGTKLARQYDAFETGNFEFDDLAPRIKDHKGRRDEIQKARLLLGAEMVAQGITEFDARR